MKITKLDYINILFAVILVLLIVLSLVARFQHKEFDKILWNAEIYSSTENSSPKTQNIIKVLDAFFYNTLNKYPVCLDNDFEKETDGFINAVSKKHIAFEIREKQLLPDSLNLKYFSVDERKFYSLKTILSYEKIKNLFNNHKKEEPLLSLEVLPKGKTILKFNTTENENVKSQIIEVFTAKETTGDLDQLICEESFGKTYNDYEGIESITDFSDLLQNQYIWDIEIKKEEQDLTSLYTYSFGHEKTEFLENNELRKLRNIPKEIHIHWKDENSITYTFDPKEVLKAFRKLNMLGTTDKPITFKFKTKNSIQFEISKNGVVIPLKDLYSKL